MTNSKSPKHQEFFEIEHEFERPNALNANLTSIQVLRGFAVLMVGFAHLHSVETKLGGPIIFGDFFLNGFSGVDLFFLISGFVMVYSNRDSNPSISNSVRFWVLRLFRIYPLWWLICGAIFVVYLYRPDWVYSSHNSNPDILKSFLLIPQNDLPLHAVGWTLIHELWFYLVFGFVILLPRIATLPLLIVWSLVSFIGFGIETNSPIANLITHPLTIEFIAGCFCALLIGKISNRLAVPILIAGIFMFVFAIIMVGDNPTAFFAKKSARILYFTIPFALIILGSVKLEESNAIFPSFLKKIGDWSYSFYLLHVPVFAFVGRSAAPFSSPQSIGDNVLFAFVALGLTILSSAICYIYFERPILRFAHQTLGKQSPIV